MDTENRVQNRKVVWFGVVWFGLMSRPILPKVVWRSGKCVVEHSTR